MVTSLCFGDPHFHTNNIYNIEIAMTETIALTRKLNPTFVVILGDVLHEHNIIHTPAYKLAVTWIELLSRICHVYVLIGNHDYIDHTQFLTDNHIFGPLKKWPRVTIVDEVIVNTWGGYKFTFCPYVEPGRFEEALNTIGESWKDSTCIFAHQEFRGAKFGGKISEDGDSWASDLPPVISGHIHEAQIVNENIYYTGSLMQHAQGDTGEKNMWLLQFSGNTWQYFLYQFQNLKPRKTIKIKISEFEEFDLSVADTCYLRLILTGTNEEKKVCKISKKYKDNTTPDVRSKNGLAITFETKNDKNTNEKVEMSREFITFENILANLIKDKSTIVQNAYNSLVSKGIL